ncbi:ASCH domain-containing protein [Latilactobacillus fuchuensis]|uniref:ASCH domain protein n=2 Tax=Latilactobacillus fuchuensis TaxID=164393 RepID=A0A2N9DVV2_9LACO|nr:ASCH domain-containing protein [Latilactobacillus fuchuensis]KRL58503.1 ASCH domain protein [Latilactobacillus fuchuensis DSM 14340 = JCM 11249]SPC38646.1 ASCH domain protein [Latilactobacillus fuchuensis]
MQKAIQDYWQQFVTQQQLSTQQPVQIYAFGDNPAMADELAQLVISGQKTATTSAIALYTKDEPVPQVGDYNIILDGQGQPVAITQTSRCDIVDYQDVTEEHAYLEGEGNRTLAYWRSVHEPFFKAEYEASHQLFSPTMPCLCEQFILLKAKKNKL